MGPRKARATWLVALAGLGLLAAWASWRSRRSLGLSPIPLAVVVAAVLYSEPFLVAMERGQCDPLAFLFLLAAAGCLRSRLAPELAAGAILAVAAWMKYYPGMAIGALVALGRWRGLASFVATAAAIGLADVRGVLRSIENGRILVAHLPSGGIHPCDHSLNHRWADLWSATPLPWLGQIPGVVGATALILPLIGWVVVRVGQGAGRERLTYPLMLWLVAAAAFLPPIANDYNLVALPLAALALWDRRDAPAVHALMAPMLLWWQPLALEIGGRPLMWFRLGGLLAVGMSLVARAGEAAPRRAGPHFGRVAQRAGDAETSSLKVERAGFGG